MAALAATAVAILEEAYCLARWHPQRSGRVIHFTGSFQRICVHGTAAAHEDKVYTSERGLPYVACSVPPNLR